MTEASMDVLAPHGEVILLGSPRTPYKTNLTRFLHYFHNHPWYHTLKGALEFSKHSIERNSKIIITLIRGKKLLIKPICSHMIKPSGIQAAFDGLRNQPDEFMGVIIDRRRSSMHDPLTQRIIHNIFNDECCNKA